MLIKVRKVQESALDNEFKNKILCFSKEFQPFILQSGLDHIKECFRIYNKKKDFSEK